LLAYSSLDGVLFDKTRTTLLEAPKALGGGYAVPDGVTSIGSDAFEACSRLTRITFPSSVAILGEEAFLGCVSLTNAVMAEGLVSIGKDAFDFCTSLASLTLPSSITNVGEYAFEDCFDLTNVYFKGDAPTFGYGVFANIDQVTVYYLPGTLGWDALFPDFRPVLWHPLIQTGGGGLGVQNHRFAFDLAGPASVVVGVEATAKLASQVWLPLQTVTLTNGLVHFSDPEPATNLSRYYRLRSP
jgi:hypothetical protein